MSYAAAVNTSPVSTDYSGHKNTPGTVVTLANDNAFDLSAFCSPEAVARQVALEETSKAEALARFKALMLDRQAAGKGSDTGVGKQVVRGHMETLAKAINWAHETGKALHAYGTGGDARGRRVDYANLLRQLPADVTALLTLKAVVDACFSADGSQTVAARILGVALETEAMVLHFLRREPDLVTEITAGLKARGSDDAYVAKELRRQMLTRPPTLKKEPVEWVAWDKTVRRHYALDLIAMAVLNAELFESDAEFVEFSKGKPKTMRKLRFSEAGREWFQKAQAMIEAMVTVHLPMVCVPVAWDGPWGGGYASAHVAPTPLVRGADRPYLRSLRDHDLTAVYGSINAVQSTPWSVNADVLAAVKGLWGDVSKGILGAAPNKAGLPGHFGEEKPARLEGEPGEQELADHKKKLRLHYNRRVRIESKGRRVDKAIWLAEKFAPERAFFFPHSLDFRGRMYSLVADLSPQGADLERGLLQFAEAKPLETEEAACWLAIHGANSFGKDKLPLQERVQWVTDNEERIKRVAENPVGQVDWWGTADKPFMFLAFCFEWSRFCASEGGVFESRLPISLDGTCNGLQHLSAMTRDEEGGQFVNLVDTPDGKPADVYSRVAAAVTENLQRLRLLGPEDVRSKQAEGWVKFGIDRKLTKRTVMVVPYGGTTKACREYVRQAVNERLDAGGTCVFERGRELLDASTMLANTVWDSLSDTLSGARRTMKWLRQCAQRLGRQGKPIKWTTPDGFPVVQAYKRTEDMEIRYGPRRLAFKAKFRRELQTINPFEQANGISPNYTHSLDAAHLRMTVNVLFAQGVTGFAMVHDSYGTHAADVGLLTSALRETFAAIYETDPLKTLEEELKGQFNIPEDCPARPAYGSWEPSSVLSSSFFFH